MNDTTIEKLRAVFHQQFSSAPSVIVRAPGRVNLIGEHTDYNDGFVMPLAIDRAAWIAARPRDDRQVVLWSENFHIRTQFALDQIEHAAGDTKWSNYTRGVAHILQSVGYVLRGMDAVVWGDVPIGAGLSSSAALEVASAYVFIQLSNCQLPITNIQLAQLAQRAEIEFVGVNCGIMDQMVSALGQAGHALLIDCRSLAYQPVPIPDGVAIVIADTMKRRDLVDSKYNERRAECEEGARLLGVKSLRDVSLDDFNAVSSTLPEVIRRRCRHVISENARVLACVESLRAGNLKQAGQLLIQSHDSLRDDYEVSCRELDVMVDLTLKQPCAFGTRMTGAGFGGCTVNVVAREHAETFVTNLVAAYERALSVTPSIYVCRATRGAQTFSQKLLV